MAIIRSHNERGRNRGTWTPNTDYNAGDLVIQAGVPYYANVDHVSGSTFNASNWTVWPVGSSANLVWFTFTLPGDLSLITGSVPFPVPVGITVTGMKATVGTRPAGSSIVLDVIRTTTTTSSSLFTNTSLRPTIPAGGRFSSLAVPDSPVVNASDSLTVNIVQIGTTVPGADLVLTIRALES